MSFSSLVQDIAFRDSSSQPNTARTSASNVSTNDTQSTISRPSMARSYTSTAATSVSIAGDIKSQLHAGYSHSLSRAWQAERQLTKVSSSFFIATLST
jgi:porphobilinogen synthase